jgi:hypothetical protein
MAKGARPGAGRPRGSKRARPEVVAAQAMLAATVAQQTDYQDALAFCLDCLNDPTLPMSDRIRIAIALLPFQHSKMGEIGKKERTQMEAERIAGRVARPLTENEENGLSCSGTDVAGGTICFPCLVFSFSTMVLEECK